MNNEIYNKTKELLLDLISDDYTDIGYLGILEDEIPELGADKEKEKQYVLKSIGELLHEGKIRVGNLNDGPGLFLNYWDMSNDEIINKIDREWDYYFSPKWEYDKLPTFDLTESYAKEIGKYQSDQEKIEKEQPK